VTQEAGKDAPPEGRYPIVLAASPNGDGPSWTATVEELPGCQARGATPAIAAAAVEEAVERWIANARAKGREIPPPGAAAAHSGKLLVRMPRSLHAELGRASEREGTSLNAYIVAALSASVAWRRPGEPGAAAAQPPPTRGLSLALKVNVIVLTIAAVIAIALLLTAWLG
jgi:antitoxin HicB